MKLTGDTDFDSAIRKLTAGIRGLDGTADRRLARRNARQRVLKALRRVRTVLDEKAPAIAKPRGEIKHLTFKGRVDRLTRKGWKRCDELAADYAAAGVPVRAVEIPREMASGTVRMERALFVPGWAAAIGHGHPTKLRAAKKDRALQRSVVAEKILQESA